LNAGRLFSRAAKRHAAITALIAAAVITAAAVFYMSRANIFEPKSAFYVYGVGARFEYGADAKLALTKDGVVIRDGNGREYDPEHAPLFFAGEARALLTAPMLAVSGDGRQGSVGAFTEVSLTDGGALIRTEKEEFPRDGGFLFDGGDVYLFLEGGEIIAGEARYRVTPMTFVVAVRGARIEIYTRDAEKGLMLDAKDVELTARMDGGYGVDLGKDILRADGADMLLFTDPSMIARLTPFAPQANGR
jgi:hypothetical protein